MQIDKKAIYTLMVTDEELLVILESLEMRLEVPNGNNPQPWGRLIDEIDKARAASGTSGTSVRIGSSSGIRFQ